MTLSNPSGVDYREVPLYVDILHCITWMTSRVMLCFKFIMRIVFVAWWHKFVLCMTYALQFLNKFQCMNESLMLKCSAINLALWVGLIWLSTVIGPSSHIILFLLSCMTAKLPTVVSRLVNGKTKIFDSHLMNIVSGQHRVCNKLQAFEHTAWFCSYTHYFLY